MSALATRLNSSNLPTRVEVSPPVNAKLCSISDECGLFCKISGECGQVT